MANSLRCKNDNAHIDNTKKKIEWGGAEHKWDKVGSYTKSWMSF